MTRPVDHDSRSPRRKTTTRRQPLPPVVEAPAHVLAAPRWMLEVSTPSRPIDPTAVPQALALVLTLVLILVLTLTPLG